MTSIRSFDDLCQRIAARSRNNPSPRPPETAQDRKKLIGWSLADATIFTANGLAAGTPATPYVAVPTIAWGFARFVFGALQGCGFCSSDATPAQRTMRAGAALMAGGLASFVPYAGTSVNFALAAWSGAQAAAVGLTRPQTTTLHAAG